jgi:hypothetical protein
MTSKRGKLTERQQIIKSFAQIICEQGDRGVGSGLEHSERWKATRDKAVSSKLHGNSANVAHAASSAAANVCISYVHSEILHSHAIWNSETCSPVNYFSKTWTTRGGLSCKCQCYMDSSH